MQSSLLAEPIDRNIKAVDLAEIGDIAKIVGTAPGSHDDHKGIDRRSVALRQSIAGFLRSSSGMSSGPQENIMKHRGVDFDVEEKPPSWWHWKICPRTEGGQPVIATMKFQTRVAAVDACIIEINGLLDKGQGGGGSE
jgi:hypothetical protein